MKSSATATSNAEDGKSLQGAGNSEIGKRELTIYDKFNPSIEIEPGVRASSLLPKGQLLSTPPYAPQVKTMWDAFQRGLSISPKGNCIGWRSGNTYSWWTYEEVSERVRQLCGALKTKTILSRQQFVGIYSPSCPQWLICSLAIHGRSMCVAPLYDTLGPDSRAYIINQVEMTLIFVDSVKAADRILDSAKETPTLKTIVCFGDDLAPELLEKAKAGSISLVTFNDFASGTDPTDTDVYDAPKDEDIAVLQFTSGTTGYPKGAILTHRAIIASMIAVDYLYSLKLDPAATMSETDVALLFMPLAHNYAQIVSAWFFFLGASVGFYGGNIAKIAEDAAILKPTFVPMVPRILNRVYNKIKTEVGTSGWRAAVFWYCYNRKKDLVMSGTITRNSIWDYIAFRRIQNIFGGNVRIISSGSAPISADVLEFWRVCFGVQLIEGYGQTECAVVATMTMGPLGGHVGHPLPCNHIKLADVEECGYLAKYGKGEICIRGPNLMSGYYKEPEKTAETIDADGWLHTGDIGEFLPDGALRLFDRKKHIFKLAQGEYIAPEKIENVYIMCPLVAQVFVDGSSLEAFTFAIVVPDMHAAKSWAEKNEANPDTVLTNPDFAKHVLSEMLKVGKENKLSSLEQVKNIHLTGEAFSPENGLLTPSLKNRRAELRRAFKGQIDAMYKAGPLSAAVTCETN